MGNTPAAQRKTAEDPDGPVTLVENTVVRLLEEKKDQLDLAKAGDMAAIQELAAAAKAENLKVFNALVEHVNLLHKREATLREQVAAAKRAPKPPSTASAPQSTPAEVPAKSPDMQKLHKQVQEAHEAHTKTEQAAAMLEERIAKLESERASAAAATAKASAEAESQRMDEKASQADEYKRQLMQASKALEATQAELVSQTAAAVEASRRLEATQAELSAQKAATQEAQSERAELQRQLAVAQEALAAAQSEKAAAPEAAKQAALTRQDYSGGVLAGKPIPKTKIPSMRTLTTQASPSATSSSVRAPMRPGVPTVALASPGSPTVTGTRQPQTSSHHVLTRPLGSTRIIQSSGAASAPRSAAGSMRAA